MKTRDPMPLSTPMHTYRVVLEITIDPDAYEFLRDWDWHTLLDLNVEEGVFLKQVKLIRKGPLSSYYSEEDL